MNSNNSGSTSGMNGNGGACYVYPDAPATPGKVTPDVSFNRGVYMNGSFIADDGRSIPVWGFTDSSSNMGAQFPSPAIRVREGQIVHTVFTNQGMMWLHTIHHHGIEPSAMNDGVGHTSFDVSGTYTYQWKASHAGTYFYHCHTNTVLHAEMGMYGALIVDPVDGPGKVFTGGPSYDVEAIWAADEFDSNWHSLSWDAGTCGGDVGLNDLNPDYFIITGVDGAASALTASGVAVTMTQGQTLLVRYINAGYYPQKITFGGLTGTVVCSDGRALPKTIQATSINSVSAERYDVLLTPSKSGTYTVEIDFLDWVTGKAIGQARTRINVN